MAKSSFVEKNLQTALEKLAVATAAVDKAVTVRTVDAKKNLVAVKRLTKRKATLTKRKKLAAGRVKKATSVETRGALRTVTKDLATTTKELAKLRAVKASNGEELKALKASQRRIKGYNKGIAQTDAALNKE
ncbi:MAG: hypothetical protein KUG77_10045 [Nannocystaceae bacterium]|nr:hypothetical protein [Nannocystaceae bacterium]